MSLVDPQVQMLTKVKMAPMALLGLKNKHHQATSKQSLPHVLSSTS